MESDVYKELKKVLMQCTRVELTSLTCSVIKALALKISTEDRTTYIPSEITLCSENDFVRWDFTINIKEEMTDKGKKDYEAFCASPGRIKETIDRLMKEGVLY